MKHSPYPDSQDDKSTPEKERPVASKPFDRKETKRRYVLINFFVAFAILCLSAYLIVNMSDISHWFKDLFHVFSPIIIGIIIAYFCNPILVFFEKVVFKKMRFGRGKRALALLCTYVLVLGLIAAFFYLVIPELVNNFRELLGNYNTYLNNTVDAVNRLIQNSHLFNSETQPLIDSESIKASVVDFFTTTSNIVDIISNYALRYISSIVNGITTILAAFFVSVYFLASKELRYAQFNRAAKAMLNKKQDTFLRGTAVMVDRSFGGYIRGQFFDALIIGIESFIVFTIFGMPYTLLISTIIAVTNIIPYFGPFLGAIPSGLIILVARPSKLLLFVILIFIMQQIDGNIVAPRILGTNTGVSSLCIICAIIIMGNYWGFIGMVLGVPIFSVVVNLLEAFIRSKLEKKNFVTEIESYYAPGSIPFKKRKESVTVRLFNFFSSKLEERRRKKHPEKYTVPSESGIAEAKADTEKTESDESNNHPGEQQ